MGPAAVRNAVPLTSVLPERSAGDAQHRNDVPRQAPRRTSCSNTPGAVPALPGPCSSRITATVHRQRVRRFGSVIGRPPDTNDDDIVRPLVGGYVRAAFTLNEATVRRSTSDLIATSLASSTRAVCCARSCRLRANRHIVPFLLRDRRLDDHGAPRAHLLQPSWVWHGHGVNAADLRARVSCMIHPAMFWVLPGAAHACFIQYIWNGLGTSPDLHPID